MKKQLLAISLMAALGNMSAMAAEAVADCVANCYSPAEVQKEFTDFFGSVYSSVTLPSNTWTQPTKPGVYARQSGAVYKWKKVDDVKTTLFNTEVGYVHAFEGLDATVGAEVDFDLGRYGDSEDHLKDRGLSMRIFGSKHFGNSWIQAAAGYKRTALTAEDDKFKFNIYGFQVAGGHKFDIQDGFFVEPSVKLAYNRVSLKLDGNQDFVTEMCGQLVRVQGELSAVKFKGFNSLVGQVGVKAGKNFGMGNVWADASIAREFMGKASVRGDKGSVSGKTKQYFYSVNVGGDVTVAKNFTVEAKAGVLAGKYFKVSPTFMIGARYAF